MESRRRSSRAVVDKSDEKGAVVDKTAGQGTSSDDENEDNVSGWMMRRDEKPFLPKSPRPRALMESSPVFRTNAFLPLLTFSLEHVSPIVQGAAPSRTAQRTSSRRQISRVDLSRLEVSRRGRLV